MPIADDRIQWTVEQIRAFMREPEAVYLPSIRALAKSCRTGIHVVSAAVGRLREAGELDFRRGQRMRIVSRWPRVSIAPAGAGSSLHAAYSTLCRHIQTGALRVGNPLPKRTNLNRDLRVSDRTLGKVLARLSSEGMIHRAGRAWIVGPATGPGVRASTDPPVILIVLLQADAWTLIQKIGDFALANAFVNECSAHGVRILFCHVQTTYGSSAYAAVGADAIAAMARNLGKNYLGALIAGTFSRARKQGQRVADELTRRGRPVLWLDVSGDRASPEEALRQRMCRCSFDEEAMAALSVDYLRSMGHTRIGFAGYFQGWLGIGTTVWEKARRELLREEVSRTIPGGRMVAYDDACARLAAMTREECASLVRHAWTGGSPGPRKILDYLAALLPASGRGQAVEVVTAHLHAAYLHFRDRKPFGRPFWAALEPLSVLLVDPEVTAIISRDLASAEIIVERFSRARIDVPGDISVLSYDNLLSSRLPIRRYDPKIELLSSVSYRITTVDCGAERLGYLAFHRIYGDLPLRGTPNNPIAATPRIADRWSVARLSHQAPTT